MHTVAVLAVSDTIGFDLSTAVETFGRAQLASGEPAYRVMVCAAEPVVQAGAFRISTDHDLGHLTLADTIVVPGRHDVTSAVPVEVCAALRDAYARGTRIASICTGAFLLAAAGLLDGRRATTHWGPTSSVPHFPLSIWTPTCCTWILDRSSPRPGHRPESTCACT